MLRKLFIGLLILSALTAKGAGSGISEASESFSPESLLSLCGDGRHTEVAASREIILSGDIPGFGRSALVPLGEFLPVKSLEQHMYCSVEGGAACGCDESFPYCAKSVLCAYDRNIITSGTDISPPAL